MKLFKKKYKKKSHFDFSNVWRVIAWFRRLYRVCAFSANSFIPNFWQMTFPRETTNRLILVLVFMLLITKTDMVLTYFYLIVRLEIYSESINHKVENWKQIHTNLTHKICNNTLNLPSFVNELSHKPFFTDLFYLLFSMSKIHLCFHYFSFCLINYNAITNLYILAVLYDLHNIQPPLSCFVSYQL